jgi:uracil-DNA glycosylase family 4
VNQENSVTTTSEHQMSELETIASQIRSCTDCPLSLQRTHAVPGEGPHDASLMLIGEGPGFHEDQQGRPFVGVSGQYLETLLGSIGMSRNQVFITNVVKCRPPNNRDPLPEEIKACSKYLERQTEVLRPKAILTLGRFSMARYFPREMISRIHGTPQNVDGQIVVPLYHPAAALHQGSLRTQIEADFRRIPSIVNKVLEPLEGTSLEQKPHQPRLFS